MHPHRHSSVQQTGLAADPLLLPIRQSSAHRACAVSLPCFGPENVLFLIAIMVTALSSFPPLLPLHVLHANSEFHLDMTELFSSSLSVAMAHSTPGPDRALEYQLLLQPPSPLPVTDRRHDLSFIEARAEAETRVDGVFRADWLRAQSARKCFLADGGQICADLEQGVKSGQIEMGRKFRADFFPPRHHKSHQFKQYDGGRAVA